MQCHATLNAALVILWKILPLCRWWKNSLHHWTTEGHPSTSTSYNCCEWSLYVYDCHWKTLLTTKWQDWLCNILQLHHTSTSCKFWRNVQEHAHYLHHIKEDTSYVNLPDNNFMCHFFDYNPKHHINLSSNMNYSNTMLQTCNCIAKNGAFLKYKYQVTYVVANRF